MRNTENTPHRIDDYLQRIEEREKAARRKKLMIGGAAVLSALLGLSLVYLLSQNKEIRKYSIQELSKERVTEIFDEDDSRIVIAHALGTDTISNLNEYQSLVDLFEDSDIQSAAFFGGRQDMNEDPNETDEEGFEDNAPQNILQKYSVDVSGNRVRGSQLVFTIEDYDPDIKYTLSFGTGYKRTVRRVSRYTYSRSGRFRIRLLASSENKGSSIYTKTISIGNPSTPPPATEREYITEAKPATPSTTPEITTSTSNTNTILEVEDGATRDLEDEENSEENVDALSGAQEFDGNSDETDDNAGEDTITDDQPIKAVTEEAAPVSTEPTETNEDENESEEEIDPNAPIFGAEIMPEFPGGIPGLKRYFQKNYTYPHQAREASIEGTVFVRFIVNRDGTVSNISVVRGLGYGCDKEALRLVKNMPKWIPGEHNGRRVAVYKTLPIGFKLFE